MKVNKMRGVWNEKVPKEEELEAEWLVQRMGDEKLLKRAWQADEGKENLK